jgi:hypothetical protein
LLLFLIAIINSHTEAYLKAGSRHEKVHVTQSVTVSVASNGGWFLQYDKKRQGWCRISEQRAGKKVAQAIQYRRAGNSSPSISLNSDTYQPYACFAQESMNMDEIHPSDSFDMMWHDSDSSTDEQLLTDEEILLSLGMSVEGCRSCLAISSNQL